MAKKADLDQVCGSPNTPSRVIIHPSAKSDNFSEADLRVIKSQFERALEPDEFDIQIVKGGVQVKFKDLTKTVYDLAKLQGTVRHLAMILPQGDLSIPHFEVDLLR